MKVLLSFLFCFSFLNYANSKKSNKPGSYYNKLAVEGFLYQLALLDKAKGGELLHGSCIKYDRDNEDGDVSISIATKNFETGKSSIEKGSESHKRMTGLFKHFDQFFSQAINTKTGKRGGNKPLITAKGYADRQYNEIARFDPKTKIPASIDRKHLKTPSCVRNYLLAKERVDNVVSLFPKGTNIETSAYNSCSAEFKTRPTEEANDRAACPTRRMVVLNYKLDPSAHMSSEPGKYTPRFKAIKGADQKEMVLSSVLDAGSYDDLSSLPKECQVPSVKVFHDQAKQMTKKIKKVFRNFQRNKNDFFTNLDASCTSYRRSALCTQRRELKRLTREGLASPQNLYEFTKILAKGNNHKIIKHLNEKKRTSGGTFAYYLASIAKCATLDKAGCNSDVWRKAGVKIKTQTGSLKSLDYKYYIGHKLSSHFINCFSNEEYYLGKASSQLIPAQSLPRSPSGAVKISYGEKNIPTVSRASRGGKPFKVKGLGEFKNFKGYGCRACGHGLHFNDKTKHFETFHRSSEKDHTGDPRFPNVLNEAKAIHNMFQNPENESIARDSFRPGSQATPKLLIVKNCDPSNRKNISSYDMSKLSNGNIDKTINVGDNDCIWPLDINSSCSHSPSGNSESSEGKAATKLAIYNLFSGENIEFQTSNNFKEDYDRLLTNLESQVLVACGQPRGFNSNNYSRKALVDKILCDKSHKSQEMGRLPTEGFESGNDCSNTSRQ